MKLKRFAFALCALLLAFGLPFFGCAKITDTKFRDDGVLNIIDDNNRNRYEVFVRSYYDSDEDGVGDLNGVTQKLDYIKDMGFNGIWLMPICQSNTYHGYDVADYKTVESDYGTNDDFKNLMNEAHKRGINVIVDMVFIRGFKRRKALSRRTVPTYRSMPNIITLPIRLTSDMPKFREFPANITNAGSTPQCPT